MSKGRLEAFSDGVIAILITIMVLELKVSEHAPPTFETLSGVLPKVLWYLLSFVFLGIYWNNHHHMLHAADRVTGAVLWANLHLLFWLSLVPATTSWMGDNNFEPVPTAVYGVVLLMAGVAYYILERILIANQGPDSRLAAAVGNDVKGILSVVLYGIAIPMAFVHRGVAELIYVSVALMWLVPDRRIEATLGR
jgi:TMEM175 potassium channel family protein